MKYKIGLIMGLISSVGCKTLPELVGSGNERSEDRLVGNFTKLKVGENFQVQLLPIDSNQIKVKADDNILYNVKSEVVGSTLVLRTQCECVLMPTMPIVVEVPAKQLRNVTASDNAKVSARGLQTADASFELSDSAELSLSDQSRDKLSISVEDKSSAFVSGRVGEFESSVEDSAMLDAQQTTVETAEISIEDEAQAMLKVIGVLNAKLDDKSKLTLYAEPKSTTTKVKDKAEIVRNY